MVAAVAVVAGVAKGVAKETEDPVDVAAAVNAAAMEDATRKRKEDNNEQDHQENNNNDSTHTEDNNNNNEQEEDYHHHRTNTIAVSGSYDLQLTRLRDFVSKIIARLVQHRMEDPSLNNNSGVPNVQ